MSIKVMAQVWEHSKQEGGSLLVLLAMADFADDEGVCWPTVQTLAKKSRLKERAVQYNLQQLKDAGEIEVLTRGGTRGDLRFPSKYRVLSPGAKIAPGPGATECTPPVQPNAPKPSEESSEQGKGRSSFVNKTTGTDGTVPGDAFQFPPGFRRVPAIATTGAHSSPSEGRKRAPAASQRAGQPTEDTGAGFRLTDEIDEYHETPRATPAAAAWKGAVAEIYTILRKEFPDIGCKLAPARDRNIKRFWRDHGKTVQAVRELCAKVKASDYLMKRNGHTGVLRLDFNWMFDPEKAGKIVAGDYENEKMAFLLDKAKAAEMVEVVISGSGEKKKVPASEIGDGKKYFDLGKDKLTGRLKIALAK